MPFWNCPFRLVFRSVEAVWYVALAEGGARRGPGCLNQHSQTHASTCGQFCLIPIVRPWLGSQALKAVLVNSSDI